MASVRKRVASDGTETYSVLYRIGAKQSSRTFTTSEAAEDFQILVDRFGATRAIAFLAAESPQPMGITVDELAEKWLAVKRLDLTPNIYAGYQRDYAAWIKPKLGHLEAETVDELTIQEWVDWMRGHKSRATKKPLSAKSIIDKHAIVHQIFKWGSARTRQLVDHNPCKETELPKRKKTQVKGLTLPEFQQLMRAGEGDDADRDTADLAAFLAGTSWRISEGIALLVRDVEDDGDRVYVSMRRVWRKGVGWVEDAKSDASIRRLWVLGPAAEVLRRRITGKKPDDFVFTFRDGRRGVDRGELPWNLNSFRNTRWKRLVAKAGLADRAPTPHWLRHTHVALCIAAGLSLPEIQARLGHEDIQTTINVYGRMMAEINVESAARLEALLSLPRTDVVAGEVVRGELG